jgi:hypothetical protein
MSGAGRAVFDEVVLYRKRDHRLLPLAIVFAVGGIVTAADVAGHPPAGRIFDANPASSALGITIMLVSGAVAFVALAVATKLAFSPVERTRSGRLTIGGGQIRVNGGVQVSTITGVAVVAHDVHVFDGSRRPRLVVVASSETQAAELAAAARSVCAHGLARFRFNHRDRAFIWLGLGGLVVTVGLGMMFHHPASLLVLPLFLGPALWPTTAVVGSDGIVLTGLRPRRLIPFARIVAVAGLGDELVLTLDSGRPLSFVFDGERSNLEAFVGRVECARAKLLDAPAFEQFLEKRSESTHEWVARLRALGLADYRQSALPKERLFDVLTNGSCAPTSRIAAAVLLRAGMTDADRERLQLLANETVSPPLRRALVLIAEMPDPFADERLLDILDAKDAPTLLSVGRS